MLHLLTSIKYNRCMNNTLFWKSALIFALIMIAFCKWQSSEAVWANYDDICVSNYNHTESYYECMSTFEKQSAYYNYVFYFMVAVEVLSIGMVVKGSLGGSKKTTTTKKQKGQKS